MLTAGTQHRTPTPEQLPARSSEVSCIEDETQLVSEILPACFLPGYRGGFSCQTNHNLLLRLRQVDVDGCEFI